MIPPLLVVILGVPQFTLNLFVPLLLLEEPEPGLVFLAGPLGEPELGFTLGVSSLLLELDDSLEFLDGSRDSLVLGLAFGFDDLGKSLGVLLF
jgi:hypothetical protein